MGGPGLAMGVAGRGFYPWELLFSCMCDSFPRTAHSLQPYLANNIFPSIVSSASDGHSGQLLGERAPPQSVEFLKSFLGQTIGRGVSTAPLEASTRLLLGMPPLESLGFHHRRGSS